MALANQSICTKQAWLQNISQPFHDRCMMYASWGLLLSISKSHLFSFLNSVYYKFQDNEFWTLVHVFLCNLTHEIKFCAAVFFWENHVLLSCAQLLKLRSWLCRLFYCSPLPTSNSLSLLGICLGRHPQVYDVICWSRLFKLIIIMY